MTQPTGAMLRPLAVMMSRQLRTIEPRATVADAARQMREAKVGALLVGSEGEYRGVISESDLVRKVMAEGYDPNHRLVESTMSQPIITVEIDRSAYQASDLMAEKGIRHLVITEDGQIVGMISVRDLLRYFKNWGAM